MQDHAGSEPLARAQRRVRRILIVLYIFAATLIGRAAVTQNIPSFDLQDYSTGRTSMPFQARYLMVPVLKWAAQDPLAGKLADALHNSVRNPQELLIQFVNCLCLIAIGFVTVRLRRQFTPAPLFDWLAPLLLLWIVAITYAVRYDQRLFTPYDFLSVLLFTGGILACLEKKAWLLLLIMSVATWNRETSLFLLPVWLVCNWKAAPGKALLIAATGLLIWLAIRLDLKWILQGTSSGLDFPWRWDVKEIFLPHHWAQLFSVAGYLAIPMWLRRDLVTDRRLRSLWLGLAPFISGALIFGIWIETRVFGEISAITAITAAVQFETYIRRMKLTGHAETAAGEAVHVNAQS